MVMEGVMVAAQELSEVKPKKSKRKLEQSQELGSSATSDVPVAVSADSTAVAAAAATVSSADETLEEYAPYVSPIANPIIDGKALDYATKLVRKALVVEKVVRSLKKSGGAVKLTGPHTKCLKRGVQEVTKSLRRGDQGVALFASDVFPIDIIAHLPVLCEEKGVLYAYMGNKRSIGSACKSTRPSSVLLISQPHQALQKALESENASVVASSTQNDQTDGHQNPKKKRKRGDANNDDTSGEGDDGAQQGPSTAAGLFQEYQKLFKKTAKAIAKCHPYF